MPAVIYSVLKGWEIWKRNLNRSYNFCKYKIFLCFTIMTKLSDKKDDEKNKYILLIDFADLFFKTYKIAV